MVKEYSEKDLQNKIKGGSKVKVVKKKTTEKPKENPIMKMMAGITQSMVGIAQSIERATNSVLQTSRNMEGMIEANKYMTDNVLQELRKPEPPKEKRKTRYKIKKINKTETEVMATEL